MSNQLRTLSIAAPGFAGLNTQDSPIDMPIEFCSIGDNCVIDKFGRVAARKGYNVLTETGAPGTEILSTGFFEDSAGNTTVYSATASAIYKGTDTMTSVYSTSVTDGHWQYINFNEQMIFIQAGHDPLVASSGGSPALLSQTVGTDGASLAGANVGMGAYGRLWLADTTAKKSTLYWSDLLTPATFNSGSAGALNLNDVWPQGQDEITAVAAHNGFLIILGRHSIVIYDGVDGGSPATDLNLVDTVSSVGCVSRDSVVSTGADLLFLSAEGVRSFGRTVQEKSMPQRDISGNVRDDIQLLINTSTTLDEVKAIYSPLDSFYAVLFPAETTAYVFDLRRPLQDGNLRATRWPNCPFTCFTRDWETDTIYVGGASGMGSYSGYTDDGSSYLMSYLTHQNNFGLPLTEKMLKKIRPVIIGTSGSNATIKWGFDFEATTNSQTLPLEQVIRAEYGTAEYNIAEYGAGAKINILNVNAFGSGTKIQVGLDVTINGDAFSIQELTLYATTGRVTW